MVAFFFIPHRGGWRHGESLGPPPLYLEATAACFAAIIAMQMVNVWLRRSEPQPVSASEFFSNPPILWGIGLEIALIAFVVRTQ